MPRPSRGAVPIAVVIFLALLFASLAGLPVAGWAAGIGMLLFALAAFAMILGQEDAAKALLRPFVACLAVAIFAGAVAHGVVVALHDPRVLGLLCAVVALGLFALALRMLTLAKPGAKLPKLTVRERIPVRNPTPSRGPTAHRQAGSRRREDDLGIFGGGRHGPH